MPALAGLVAPDVVGVGVRIPAFVLKIVEPAREGRPATAGGGQHRSQQALLEKDQHSRRRWCAWTRSEEAHARPDALLASLGGPCPFRVPRVVSTAIDELAAQRIEGELTGVALTAARESQFVGVDVEADRVQGLRDLVCVQP